MKSVQPSLQTIAIENMSDSIYEANSCSCFVFRSQYKIKSYELRVTNQANWRMKIFIWQQAALLLNRRINMKEKIELNNV